MYKFYLANLVFLLIKGTGQKINTKNKMIRFYAHMEVESTFLVHDLKDI